jgi:hypothetical protein
MTNHTCLTLPFFPAAQQSPIFYVAAAAADFMYVHYVPNVLFCFYVMCYVCLFMAWK